MLKIKDIPDGTIVWFGDAVIGVKGATLPEIFNDCACYKIPGNAFDYELAEQEFRADQEAFIKEAEKEWDIEDD